MAGQIKASRISFRRRGQHQGLGGYLLAGLQTANGAVSASGASRVATRAPSSTSQSDATAVTDSGAKPFTIAGGATCSPISSAVCGFGRPMTW